ncbi:hypothetical protein NPIL_283021 [Nephila pilipes]|uniref:Uncharacterized protein n=1 Tax=Nephila pilipes TaxID=299642 RepID=A0A8X6U2S2_NEPPI|nr:hypothetical protein NPIL_283021 [Nephila pilipes]
MQLRWFKDLLLVGPVDCGAFRRLQILGDRVAIRITTWQCSAPSGMSQKVVSAPERPDFMSVPRRQYNVWHGSLRANRTHRLNEISGPNLKRTSHPDPDFMTVGSVLHEKGAGRPGTSDENFEQVLEAFLCNPKNSPHGASQTVVYLCL